MIRKLLLVFSLLVLPCLGDAKLPELTPEITKIKIEEILKAHASYKVISEDLVKRALQTYLEELDPTKTYFIEPDIHQWLDPSEDLVRQVLNDYKRGSFEVFQQINSAMVRAILRRRELEKKINLSELPLHVSPKEFKDMKWVNNEQELLSRLIRIKALQVETSAKLNEELRDKALQRIDKRQLKYEEEFLNQDPVQRERLVLTDVLKAFASALDTHTAYFTPDEAAQFMISVQQRLSGIGAQLRDDLNGFTVMKIVEGGPAAIGKELKVKDRIIAVNGEPVVGMDIQDAVDLIRGQENTDVTLTIIRETKDGDQVREEKRDIVVRRGEVVLKETRFSTAYEPYGDGVIGYLRLYSFYQDNESAASDLANEIRKLQKEHKLLGVILDLRSNTGGLLAQAVEVSGLFIKKGIVVSVKDHTGAIQHLRHLDDKTAWDGPLIVLVNRSSASAAEIVAQALQDYGRAIIVGDDHTFGKGSFQTFTLNPSKTSQVNPQGEYKVTRGRYYTVSGKTPQLTGVFADITVPGPLSESEIGEKFAKHPLANDKIKPNYDDDLSDIPFTQREKIRILYKFDLQPRMTQYAPYMDLLRANASYRVEHDKFYQNFLQELKKEEDNTVEDTGEENLNKIDFQLHETYNVMRDLIYLIKTNYSNSR